MPATRSRNLTSTTSHAELALVCFVLIYLLIAWIPRRCNAQNHQPDAKTFEVIWRDGSTTNAAEIKGWSTSDTPKGGTLDASAIMGKPLFRKGNIARLVRNTKLKATLTGPYIQLTNGDILPGRIVATNLGPASQNPSSPYSVGDGQLAGESRIVVVAVTEPLSALDDRRNLIQVRRSSIARITLTDRNPNSFSPGLVTFRDGGKYTARSIRWNADGVRMLLQRSLKSADWDELADVHLPNVNRARALLQDSLAEPLEEFSYLGRMVSTSGAALTYHGSRIRTAVHGGKLCHIVQPTWALNAIHVPVESIVFTGYRSTDEIPLSLLTATLLKRQSVFGTSWPWQRNRNVTGQQLSSGNIRADLGIGMWSHREIAFDLPAGAAAFSAWVGIDRAAGEGGCVRCNVYRDEVAGKPIWTSALLLSGGEPAQVEVANLNGAKRLVLVAEFAHDERPAGYQPFDICDMVSWLSPVIRIDHDQLQATPFETEDTFPEVAGWSISDDMRDRISFRSFYDTKHSEWLPAMVLDKQRAADATVEPLVLTRELDVTLKNAWLVGSTGRDDKGKFGYRVIVKANGTHIPGTEGYDSNTTGYAPGNWDSVAYCLGEYVGQKIQLSVTVHPAGTDHDQLCGLLWRELSLSPLIQNLPDNGKPIQPDLLLRSVASLTVEADGEDKDVLKTLMAESSPEILWCPMKNGLAMPNTVNAFSCDLDPRAKRFVACLGPAQRCRGQVGPFQIWVDDQMLWESIRFHRLTKAVQIDLSLPVNPGKRLTLRATSGDRAQATWTNAGFMFESSSRIRQ